MKSFANATKFSRKKLLLKLLVYALSQQYFLEDSTKGTRVEV